MITLTHRDGREFVVNANLVEFVEATPDTVISLTTDKKILVRESVEQVVARVVAYQRRVGARGRRARRSASAE